ncbi:RER1 protein, putative [Eimeria tenella]|uniref:RER1 protein, putative n=1 Tax=Eimeria tenella TaxID=5802 RepID=U6KWZ8_EIMTE|nr:RER1 protein, putative [Eimeria tenella]CDJ42476.1 RER1 protein, putative [Eimeria tenella]|eukprot:XP_013233226.1 RER1 protein, putative [Eimeria tenella]
MMASMSAEELAEQPFSSRVWASVGRVSSTYLNRSILYLKTRWLAFFACLAFYIVRVYLLAGFFVVSYGLGIYLLNLLIGFISPQVDPETDEYVLPVRGGGGAQGDAGEFRPFLRQVPEFKAWVSGMRALLIAIGMTFFQVFDLPVFWPILLIYFILLFILTMKQQVKRMIKYKYLPFSWGKQTYGDITRGGNSGGQNYSPTKASATSTATAPSYVSHEHFAATYVLR